MQLYIYNDQITTYYITTEGKLYNKKTEKWLKGQVGNKNGYLSYNISIDGEKHRLYAHRMVAETFLPKCNEKTQVNHKDGNKLNNNVDNLEWCTGKENMKHAIENNLIKQSRPIYCFDKNKKLVCTYPSIADACRVNHFNNSWMITQLQKTEKTLSHGYYWSYNNNSDFTISDQEIKGIKKPVGQYNAEGTLIAKYESRNEAARMTGYHKQRIGDCCNGKIKTYKGYVFKYLI